MFNFKEFSIIEGLKLPIKILIPIASVTGAILFLPTEIVSQLYLTDFKEQWGFVIGIIFLISSAISILELLIKGYKKCENYYYMKKFKKKQPTILKEVSLQEMLIIALIEESPNKTILLPINDGIIKRLESKFIIVRTTNTVLSDFIEPKFPYTLNPWVSETLNSNSDITEFYENQLKANEIGLKEYFECLNSQGVFN